MDMDLLVLNFFFTCLTLSVGDFVVATTSQYLEGQTNMVFLHQMVG
jgi:hypothetical protein